MEVINKAIEIIHLLTPTEGQQYWRATDISKELGIHVSTVHRILSSLKDHGLVDQDATTKKYFLGLEFLHYGEAVKEIHILRNVLSPPLQRIYNFTKETCFITLREGSWGRVIDKIDSDKSLRFVENIGTKKPLYIGAANKVILAYLPLNTRKRIMYDLDKRQQEQLEKEINHIRKKGYAVDENQWASGVMVVSIPFFTEKGNIIASLSVGVPKFRMNAETLGTLIKHLIEVGENR